MHIVSCRYSIISSVNGLSSPIDCSPNHISSPCSRTTSWLRRSSSSSFLKLGLIDEYQILVHPIVLGRGKPLFKDLNERQKLEFIGTKTFKSGVVGLYYQPTD
jgi:hypothetical protein